MIPKDPLPVPPQNQKSKEPFFQYGFWWWWNEEKQDWLTGPSPHI